jgi:hypothetical protein
VSNASAIDRVTDHLRANGACGPVTPQLKRDLKAIERRAEFARRMGNPIELSPYMVALMRLEDRV